MVRTNSQRPLFFNSQRPKQKLTTVSPLPYAEAHQLRTLISTIGQWVRKTDSKHKNIKKNAMKMNE